MKCPICGTRDHCFCQATFSGGMAEKLHDAQESEDEYTLPDYDPRCELRLGEDNKRRQFISRGKGQNS